MVGENTGREGVLSLGHVFSYKSSGPGAAQLVSAAARASPLTRLTYDSQTACDWAASFASRPLLRNVRDP